MPQSVVRGNSITLEAQYKDGTGTLTDPTTPRISIFDPSNVAQITGAVPNRLSTGVYQYIYAVSISAALGYWSAQWQGTINGQGLISSETFQVLPAGTITPIYGGAYTFDLATNTGQVRMYIDDRDLSSVNTSLPLEQRSAIFTDEEINTFLRQANNDVMYASALGLITISGNRQLLVQSRRIGKSVVDFGEVRKSLQAQAKALISMSNMQPADGIAEIDWNDFTLRQILLNTQLRMQ